MHIYYTIVLGRHAYILNNRVGTSCIYITQSYWDVMHIFLTIVLGLHAYILHNLTGSANYIYTLYCMETQHDCIVYDRVVYIGACVSYTCMEIQHDCVLHVSNLKNQYMFMVFPAKGCYIQILWYRD